MTDYSFEDMYEKHTAIHQMLEEKEYKRFDQMSLAELEALVERLNRIIEGIKRQAGTQSEES